MLELEPIDRDRLGPILGPHIELIGVIQRRQRALYAVGGAVSLAAAIAAPLTVSHMSTISGFQALLLSIIALLGVLTLLRALAAIRVRQLRQWFEHHCLQQGVELAPILAAARLCPERFFFFNALWDGATGDNLSAGVDASPPR